mmetsp:Transcript_81544/g.253398  ORF Transcript_81544/g.253398 Transcript_81544/m.253398 type:complete len:218 (-) Transcript_81544:582-1235(-)
MKCPQQKVNLLESAEDLEEPDDGHEAQQDAVGHTFHIPARNHEANSCPNSQWGCRCRVDDVEDAPAEGLRAWAATKAKQEFQEEDQVNGSLQHRCRNPMERRGVKHLQERYEDRHENEGRRNLRQGAGQCTRLRVVQDVPDPSPQVVMRAPREEPLHMLHVMGIGAARVGGVVAPSSLRPGRGLGAPRGCGRYQLRGPPAALCGGAAARLAPVGRAA